MKKILFVLLVGLFYSSIVFAQADSYKPYIVPKTNSSIGDKPSIFGDILARYSANDTLIVISVHEEKHGSGYIEVSFDGVVGYINNWHEYFYNFSEKDFKDFLKYQKSKGYSREERIAKGRIFSEAKRKREREALERLEAEENEKRTLQNEERRLRAEERKRVAEERRNQGQEFDPVKDLREYYIVPFTEEVSAVGDRGVSTAPQLLPLHVGILTSATGWSRETDGEWVSRENEILSRSNDIKDNFIRYKLSLMPFADSMYVVLEKSVNSGYYKYPNIQQDWVPTVYNWYYIFRESELDHLELKDGEVNRLKLRFVDRGIVDSELIGKNFLDNIKKRNENKGTGKEWFDILNIWIYPNKAKGTVRFIEKGGLCEISESGNEIIEFSLDNPLENGYYETSYANFSKFIPLP